MNAFYKYSFLIIAALVLAGVARPAAAQFVWQRAVGTAGNRETAAQMLATPTGLVTVGKYSPLRGNGNEGLYLSKVDFRGDTLWTRRWALRGVFVLHPQGLIADRAGNLVVTALTFGLGAPSLQEGLLVKLTAAGDTLWTRVVPSSGGYASSLAALTLGNDGNYVAIGLLNDLPALFKYDPAGTQLWVQLVPYDSVHTSNLQNLVAVPRGYLILSIPTGGQGVLPKFITVDEQGIYQLERPAGRYATSKLQLDSQGDVLSVGGYLTKLTLTGDTIWSHSYYQYGVLLGLSRLVELPNGNYLAAGTRFNTLDNDLGFVLLDHDGTLLRDTLLVRFQSEESVAGVGLTPAGDYVVAAGTDPGPIGGGDQLVFAYRSWARLLPTRAAALAASSAPVRVVAYPNPTSDAATLVASDGHQLRGRWQLQDLLGRVVQGGTLAGQPAPHLSLAGLPPGLYLLHLTEINKSTSYTLRLEKK